MAQVVHACSFNRLYLGDLKLTFIFSHLNTYAHTLKYVYWDNQVIPNFVMPVINDRTAL